jgi:hypothetical protein
MDIDELLSHDTVNPESGPWAIRPVGVDPESDSWLDAALLSYGLESPTGDRDMPADPEPARLN